MADEVKILATDLENLAKYFDIASQAMKGTAKESGVLKTAEKALNDAQNNLLKATKSEADAFKELEKIYQTAKQKVRDYNDQIKIHTSEFKKLTEQEIKVRDIERQLFDLRTKSRALNSSEIKDIKIKTSELRKEQDELKRLQIIQKDVTGETDKSSTAFGKFKTSINDLNSVVQSAVGGFNSMVGSIGLIGFSFSSIISGGLKFEKTMVDVSRAQRNFGDSSDDVDAILKSVSKSAHISQTEFVDLAEGIQNSFGGVTPRLGEMKDMMDKLMLSNVGSMDGLKKSIVDLGNLTQASKEKYQQFLSALSETDKANHNLAYSQNAIQKMKESLVAAADAGYITAEQMKKLSNDITPLTASEKERADTNIKFRDAQVQLNEAQLEFYRTMSPHLTEFLKFITAAVKSFNEWKGAALGVVVVLATLKAMTWGLSIVSNAKQGIASLRELLGWVKKVRATEAIESAVGGAAGGARGLFGSKVGVGVNASGVAGTVAALKLGADAMGFLTTISDKERAEAQAQNLEQMGILGRISSGIFNSGENIAVAISEIPKAFSTSATNKGTGASLGEDYKKLEAQYGKKFTERIEKSGFSGEKDLGRKANILGSVAKGLQVEERRAKNPEIEIATKKQEELNKKTKETEANWGKVFEQVNQVKAGLDKELAVLDAIRGSIKGQVDAMSEFGIISDKGLLALKKMSEEALKTAKEKIPQMREELEKIIPKDLVVGIDFSDSGSIDGLKKKVEELNMSTEERQKILAKIIPYADALNKKAGLENAVVKSTSDIANSQIRQQEQLTSLAETRLAAERQVMESAQFGLGASVEMMQKQVVLAEQMMQTYANTTKKYEGLLIEQTKGKGVGESITKTEIDRIKQAKTGAEAQAMITNEMQATDVKSKQLMDFWAAFQKNQTGVYNQQQKIYDLTKNVREGYLDAIREMSTGAGEFEKIIGTQEMGVSQLMDVVKGVTGTEKLNTMKLGGMQSQKQTSAGVGTEYAGQYTEKGVKFINAQQQEERNARIYQYASSVNKATAMMKGEGTGSNMVGSANVTGGENYVAPGREIMTVNQGIMGGRFNKGETTNMQGGAAAGRLGADLLKNSTGTIGSSGGPTLTGGVITVRFEEGLAGDIQNIKNAVTELVKSSK